MAARKDRRRWHQTRPWPLLQRSPGNGYDPRLERLGSRIPPANSAPEPQSGALRKTPVRPQTHRPPPGTFSSCPDANTAFNRTQSATLKWPIATPSFSLCSKASRNPPMRVSPRKVCRNFCCALLDVVTDNYVVPAVVPCKVRIRGHLRKGSNRIRQRRWLRHGQGPHRNACRGEREIVDCRDRCLCSTPPHRGTSRARYRRGDQADRSRRRSTALGAAC